MGPQQTEQKRQDAMKPPRRPAARSEPGSPGATPANGPTGEKAPDRVERELRRYWRRWLPWFVVYVAGFVALAAADLWGTGLFYAWAIGWILVRAAWVRVDFIRRHTAKDRSPSGDDGSRD